MSETETIQPFLLLWPHLSLTLIPLWNGKLRLSEAKLCPKPPKRFLALGIFELSCFFSPPTAGDVLEWSCKLRSPWISRTYLSGGGRGGGTLLPIEKNICSLGRLVLSKLGRLLVDVLLHTSSLSVFTSLQTQSTTRLTLIPFPR